MEPQEIEPTDLHREPHAEGTMQREPLREPDHLSDARDDDERDEPPGGGSRNRPNRPPYVPIA
jgi:hypothetical protein